MKTILSRSFVFSLLLWLKFELFSCIEASIPETKQRSFHSEMKALISETERRFQKRSFDSGNDVSIFIWKRKIFLTTKRMALNGLLYYTDQLQTFQNFIETFKFESSHRNQN